MLTLDLGVFHRRAQPLKVRQALIWSGLWIALAAAFAALLYIWQGHTAALEFSTGYVIELSLSADNLFIFLLIFRYFNLPEPMQYQVLFWGIIGAIAMRAAFIFAGVGLIRRFHWVIYLFGLFLIYTGLRLLFQRAAKIHPDKNPVLRMFRRIIPVADDATGKFFVRRDRLHATPLLLVLLVVFFALSALMDAFKYLHYGISCLLVFVGFKMLISHSYVIRTGVSLGIIGGILLLTIAASVLHRKHPTPSA